MSSLNVSGPNSFMMNQKLMNYFFDIRKVYLIFGQWMNRDDRPIFMGCHWPTTASPGHHLPTLYLELLETSWHEWSRVCIMVCDILVCGRGRRWSCA
jgi:hypothetical protein